MSRLAVVLALLFAAFIARADDPPAGEARFLANARQLIYDGKRSGEGYFHPDGNLLIFQTERDPANPFYQMFLLDLLSGESARVSPGTGKTTCGFFQPGSSRVLFASTHLDPDAAAKQQAELDFRASGQTRRYSWDYDPAMDLFTAGQDGTQLQQLTTARGYDAEGAFSPDGKKIVFTSTRAAFDHDLNAEEKVRLERDPAWFGDIYTMNADGSGQTRLTTSPGYDGGPFFSPDGERIVWRRFDASGMNADVFTMKTDGSDQRRVTDFRSMSWAPFFHPSGQYLIFTSNKLGFENFELFLVDAKGEREPVRVTFTDGFDGLPTFSPDGKKLCWTSNRTADHKSQLFLADWNHPAALAALDASPKRALSSDEKKTIEERVAALEKYLTTQQNDASPLPVKGGEKANVERRTSNAERRTKDLTAADFAIVGRPPRLPGQAERPPYKFDLRPEIAAEDLKKEVTWLADPAREGRATGSPGAAASADWLADYFAALGLQPLPSTFDVRRSAFDVLPSPASGADSENVERRTSNVERRTPDSPADHSAYLQPFEFDAGVKLIPDQNRLTLGALEGTAPSVPKTAPGTDSAVPSQASVLADTDFALDTDFRPLSFSDSGTAEAGVVFAGYGLSVPEDTAGPRYNSFDDLDVKDKIVLILRYVPEGVDPKRRAQLNRYAGLRYKAMLARERGAKAVLFVAGPTSPQAGELIPLTGDGTLGGSGILAASISAKAADALLAPSGKNLKDLQTALDTENPHAEGGFVLPKVRAKLTAGVEHIKKIDSNVLAYLPPGIWEKTGARPARQSSIPVGHSLGNIDKISTEKDQRPVGKSAEPEVIVVGAHYDHLGRGNASSSMAHSGEEGQIHPGADDNASGVACVMELAAALAHERNEHPERFPRGIVFACWSGEEIGLIGSAAFCEKPPVALSRVAAYVNFDMVGRLKENRLTLQGVGSSSVWRKLIEKRNVAAGFNLALQDDPYLPTDTTSFYPKRIPVLNFFTGAHEDYHRPTDTADKLDYPGTERIAKFARALVEDLAALPVRPDLARVEKSDNGGGSRETLRAYLGTIPDYTTEVKGVKLSGVRGGSPAEKGGLQGGDVLVEFAGQKITNIYDYTYALDAVKIGTPVKAVVERAGNRVELTLTPEARK